MTENNFYIDKLRLYFGEDYKISDQIVIHQPTIGEIVDFGESNLYSALMIFVANPTMYRVMLWDVGIDWNKISDYKLFQMLYKGLDKEKTKLLFGDLDFGLFQPYVQKIDTGEKVVLINSQQEAIIDEDIYNHIANYLRHMFNIFPKVEKAKGKTTKQWIIDGEKEKIKVQSNDEQNKNKSNLLPMISFCLNHPGFKYKKNELKEIGIVEFMDSVQRLQIYESTSALYSGMYGGFMDVSKIDKQQFDFMRAI